ncbi:hypothetical protein DL770_005291 [Monosporascus sp. CRB-9-2]|nr:hypothetical protein DL770_005291 [Monosporascus sp. CRB-9-2]
MSHANAGLPPGDGGGGPAGRSPSETISDSEPESTVLELALQRENEMLREQLRLLNQQEMARREINANSQPARAVEELERQKAELRRLLEIASDEKMGLEAEVERLRQQSEDSAAQARDAAAAREDFEKMYWQAQKDLNAYDVRLLQGIEHSREIAEHVVKVRELRTTWLQEADGHTETKKQLREAKEKISAQDEALRDADETRERLRAAESRLMEKEFSLAQAIRQLEALGITAEELPASSGMRPPLPGALAERLDVRERELSEPKAQLTEATARLDEGLEREEILVAEAKKANADHTRAVEALEGSLSCLRDGVTGKEEAVGRLQEANRQLDESRGRLKANACALTEELRGESAKVQALEAKLAVEKHNASSRDWNLASLQGELSSECEKVNMLRGAESLLRTGISAFLTRAFGPGPPAGWPSLLQDISRDAPEIGGSAAAAGHGSDQIWVVETP